ncbi:glyoxal oxidase N-terminus-domain-containing protein [Mycena floridula]|nr:glyoxal oxidase N-terminus-domain-containing protein [Mycena floridula]
MYPPFHSHAFLILVLLLRKCLANSLSFMSGTWSLVQQGTTGVSAMQLAVVSETTAILFDKIEQNPLTINGHVAWSSEINLSTQLVRALNPSSNTWCATGSFLGNGTMVSSGGQPVFTDLGNDGRQALRFFTPCSDESCDIYEDQAVVRLTSDRWYPSSVRIEDGSIIIFGGSTTFGFINSDNISNPSYEFYPPKNINGFNGLQIPSPFLSSTLNANHFPIMIQLPDGTIFVAANQAAMIFDWRTNTETPLPGIPNGVRVTSPFSAGAVLLPLTPENNYTPEVMICGGSTIDDTTIPSALSSQIPASDQCSRLILTAEGISAGWTVEHMPQPRIMNDLILIPDGRVVIINGAMTGVAGFGDVPDAVGASDADNPAFTPVLYDPAAPLGSRFSSEGIPASTIPRLYHSVASLTPNGTILIAGSNPNLDVTLDVEYPTEYRRVRDIVRCNIDLYNRIELYSPPYMNEPRPTYTGIPSTVDYKTLFDLSVDLPEGTTKVTVALIDLGFSTHGVHMDHRFVKLLSSLSKDKKTLTVTGPPSARIYPPGPGFLYIITDDGVPSFGHKTIIGTGASPPVDQGAIDKLVLSYR